MSEIGQLMLQHDIPLQKPAGELFAFTNNSLATYFHHDLS